MRRARSRSTVLDKYRRLMMRLKLPSRGKSAKKMARWSAGWRRQSQCSTQCWPWSAEDAPAMPWDEYVCVVVVLLADGCDDERMRT